MTGCYPASGIDERLFRLIQKRNYAFFIIRENRFFRHLRKNRNTILTLRHLHVFRNINQDRPFSSRAGNQKGLFNGLFQFGNFFHHEVMLYYRLGNGNNIHFLKTVSSQRFRCNIPGNRNKRNRIQISICNSGHQIGCPRTGCRDNHPDFPACSGITIGCMSCALLMRCKHMMYAISALVQLVVDIEYSTARITENGIHTLPNQFFH